MNNEKEKKTKESCKKWRKEEKKIPPKQKDNKTDKCHSSMVVSMGRKEKGEIFDMNKHFPRTIKLNYTQSQLRLSSRKQPLCDLARDQMRLWSIEKRKIKLFGFCRCIR